MFVPKQFYPALNYPSVIIVPDKSIQLNITSISFIVPEQIHPF